MRKVGIIGFGRIGRVHYNILKGLKGVEVSAVADSIADKMSDIFEAYGVGNFGNDFSSIINNPEIDTVFVCSPTDTHAAVAIAAAKAGKDIFCEKPIDFDIKRVEEVLDEVKKAGVAFQVGFNRRFDPNFSKAKKAILDGDVGQVHIIKITSRDPEAPPLSYVKSSGGIFADMTIHDFDMARFLAGSEPVQVFAIGDALINKEIKQYDDIDTAIITIKFENGAMAVIDNSRQAAYGYDQRIEVFGTKGMVKCENNTPTQTTLFTKEAVTKDKPLYFFLERYQESFKEELGQFFNAIETGHETPVVGKDGLVPLLMGVAAKKSLRENRPVLISEIN
ncbi:MAG: inositol 2-dehydrogenase [Chloroflexi bacterium]|nr:inositol 2-dehydrogenase [Chloroflexota bacterium]